MGLQGFALLLQVSPVEAEPPNDPIPCPEVQRVLTEFVQIFREPEGLPPQRFHDHHIPLLPGSKPVSSRPYRQPYLQKTENRETGRGVVAEGTDPPQPQSILVTGLVSKKI